MGIYRVAICNPSISGIICGSIKDCILIALPSFSKWCAPPKSPMRKFLSLDLLPLKARNPARRMASAGAPGDPAKN
jgi:hypothetical protein